uniref:ATP synthase CF1 delta subunit n=1 Tax=Cyanoptyche gloeocystis TaxID=77922 RepID=A0A3G1IWB7_9EUKA|nr:ATP synthase CF1 delta subunit [Cyanoptyche gloeocystis]
MTQKSLIISKIVQPYAEALLEIAQTNNLVQVINDDTNLILQALQESDSLQSFLTNPVINNNLKKKVIEDIFEQKINLYTKKFLMLLIDKNRISCLDGIGKKYQELVLKLNKIQIAFVITRITPSEEQKKAFEKITKKITNANEVNLNYVIDSSIVGGFKIQIGSKVIDASLRSQLFRIGVFLGV